MIRCQDLEKLGILDELASTFSNSGIAGVLLTKINFPENRRPVFTTPLGFWHTICSEIEKGLISNGLILLVNTASSLYPFNKVFSSFCEKHPILDDSPIEGEKSRTSTSKVTGKSIFISYAWGGESEQVADKLDEALQRKSVLIVRDKRDLKFKGNIKQFMEEIGKGKCVIAIISDKYLKSENCMFEMLQIAGTGNFYNRIFPIVLADAKIFKPIERIKYIQYWEEKIRELDEDMKGVSAANLQGFREDIDLYTEIRNTISDLINIMKNMNVLTPEIHEKSEYLDIIDAIKVKLEDDNE